MSRIVRLVSITKQDVALIERWLRAPHVRRWWGEPDEAVGETEAKLGVEGRALIEVDGRKVGLVIWGHPSREELDEAGLHDISTDAIDLDVMIGELDAVGHGVGREALRQAIDRIFNDPAVPYVIGATSADNAPARAAAQKAGFDTSREFEDPSSGRYVLGVRRRT